MMDGSNFNPNTLKVDNELVKATITLAVAIHRKVIQGPLIDWFVLMNLIENKDQ